MNVDVDYQSSQTWADQEGMHERMRWLRENAPIYWSETNQLFVLSRFEDVSYVSKHNDVFCSGQGVLPGNPAKLGLIDEDEPRHTKLRGLINRGFTPRMVRKLEVVFREITREAIDAVAARGECDFVEAISVPLPLLLIISATALEELQLRQRTRSWSPTPELSL